MITYHFYAMYQIKPGTIFHMDGIAAADEPIISDKQYAELKTAIAKKHGYTGESITLCSLTRLDQ